jgi:succinylglutamate desuccinylase
VIHDAKASGAMIVDRRIGCVRGARPGPTLLVTAGIHGNEVAGVLAAQRVLARLDASTLAGELLVLAGNVAAMAQGKRHEVKDLNRQWTRAKIEGLLGRDPSRDDAEDREQRALLREIDDAFERARGPVFALDLHTTSAAGYAFGIYDSSSQEAFAHRFPLPMVRGLATALAGVLSSHLCERGAIAIAVEGGQHDDPLTITHLEATLTVALAAAGLATPPDLETATDHLDAARGDIPRVMNVVARYAIRPGDTFVMAPGFANLARVKRGQLLARDGERMIRAPMNGLVILPLYQSAGDDGFFFGREQHAP